jgi:hypothetical protein
MPDRSKVQTKRDTPVLQVGRGAATLPRKNSTVTQPQGDRAGQFIGQRQALNHTSIKIIEKEADDS